MSTARAQRVVTREPVAPTLLPRRAGLAGAVPALLVLGLGVAACAGDEDPPPPAEEATQAINHADPNTSDAFAVFVSGNGALCTGALVTPRWVLTANHCITGHTGVGPAYPESDGGGITGDYTITVVPVGSSSKDASAAQQFTHSNADDGDVIVFQDEQLDLLLHDGAEDPARDLALIRLHDRVPLSLARPIHVPLLGEPGCPTSSDFTGTIFGFSGDPERRSNVVEDFTRDQVGSWGAIYDNVYHLDVLTTDIIFPPTVAGGGALIGWVNYRGIEPGDSGGPLTYGSGSNKRLCGVASNVYLTEYLDPTCYGINVLHGNPLTPFPCVGVGNRFAAVDSSQALAFLEPHLVRTDADGEEFFDGECLAAPDSDDDADHDNLVDACDVCPEIPNENDQTDSDHDGVGDACDNCVDIWNAAQANQDGDGRGDVCDPCPDDAPIPNSADQFGDADSDGVCNHEDLCPLAANPSQINTNQASEEVHASSKIWGDACDPVPVPRIAVRPTAVLWQSFDNDWLKGAIYDVTEDTFGLTPVPPHPAPGVSFSGPLPEVKKVATHFRFCQPGPHSTPPFCDDVGAIDDAQLRTDLSGPDDETPDMPYHRMSIFEVDNDTRGSTRSFDYTAAVRRSPFKLQWDYHADGAYWFHRGTVAFPCTNVTLENAGDCLEGWFWVHAHTLVGDTINPGTGYHGTELANSHTYVDVRHFSGSVASIAHPTHWLWYDMKWLPRWPDFEAVLVGDDVMLYTPVDPTLRDILATERAQAALGDPSMHWLPAVESGPNVGGDAPAAVALDAAQTQIQSAVFGKGGKILAVAEEVAAGGFAAKASAADEASKAGKASGASAAGGATAAGVRQAVREVSRSPAARAATTPPRDERAVALYSRYLGAVFILGGPASDPSVVWRSASPTDNHWSSIRLRAPLGKVLAATVSFVDSKIYVLDEISDGRQSYGRLVRLDPSSGEVEVAGQWPRRNAYARLALGLDEDGSILLTAASADAHVVLHLAAGGRPLRVLGRYDGRLAPMHPVFATANGYVLHFGEGAQLTSQRLDTVDVLTDVNLDEVGRVL